MRALTIRSLAATLAFAAVSPLIAGCGVADDDSFDVSEKFITSTEAAGKKAIPVGSEGATQVWAVTAAWSDTSTTAAKAAGMAWGANSGLRWDQKFSLWVASMPAMTIEDGTTTFQLTTPYGKTIRMPVLECSEQALMLRAVFASWYGLPFFVEANDGKQRIFLGHFGFRTTSGVYKGTPNFKTAYADYSSRGSGALANWPHDNTLRGKHLTDADGNDWLASGAGFGAWADEALLNKRVGYMLVYLLDWFGSMNLADPVNAYHLQPSSLRTGDFLLERWQKQGIGHTLVLKTVTAEPGNTFSVELASGSMPRRDPLWDDAASSREYFLSDYTGGPGNDDNGNAYASLGGGLRRYRVAQSVGGYWVNNVPSWDTAIAISDKDLASIASRPAKFGMLLADVDPEEKVQVLLDGIAGTRSALESHPASCTNRQERETYFAELYPLLSSLYGMSQAQADAQYRNTEDYYFPALDYSRSPTCCWDTTTPEMFAIIDGYNRSRESSASACFAPVPFVKSNFPVFAAYAQSQGKSADWRAWSKDEACSQASAADDVQVAQAATAYCSIQSELNNDGR